MNTKTFVSYSWTSPEHDAWVLKLATELREVGVDVILDKWDLKEGHDAIAFMEKIVTDPEIKKAILVCDHKFAEKADSRTGGVGTEAQIISPEIYAKADQLGLDTMATKTANNNYLGALFNLFVYAIGNYEKVDRNPFQNATQPTTSTPREEWDPFSLEALRTFFSSRLYRGCKSDTYGLELFPAEVACRPRLLSDNGPSYVANVLSDWLKSQGMRHARGKSYHTGQDRAMAPLIAESDLARELLPSRRPRTCDHRLRRTLQSSPLSRKPGQPHAGRRLLWTRRSHPKAT